MFRRFPPFSLASIRLHISLAIRNCETDVASKNRWGLTKTIIEFATELAGHTAYELNAGGGGLRRPLYNSSSGEFILPRRVIRTPPGAS